MSCSVCTATIQKTLSIVILRDSCDDQSDMDKGLLITRYLYYMLTHKEFHKFDRYISLLRLQSLWTFLLYYARKDTNSWAWKAPVFRLIFYLNIFIYCLCFFRNYQAVVNFLLQHISACFSLNALDAGKCRCSVPTDWSHCRYQKFY
jgi:hypothetical protein